MEHLSTKPLRFAPGARFSYGGSNYVLLGFVIEKASSRGPDMLFNAAHVDMAIPYSAGGLYSTVEDLYRWDQALYTEKLISSKSLAEILTHGKGSYGYGWYITHHVR